MSAYVIIEYVSECKKKGLNPNLKGLYEFKKVWIE